MSAISRRRCNGLEWVPLPAVVDVRGDKVVVLYDDSGRPRPRRVAEMVLEAFLGPCPPGHELRFKDGDRLNCELANLEWAGAISQGTTLVTGPAIRRPVRLDGEGRITTEDGTTISLSGLKADQVLEGLADAKAGRVRSLREIVSAPRE